MLNPITAAAVGARDHLEQRH